MYVVIYDNNHLQVLSSNSLEYAFLSLLGVEDVLFSGSKKECKEYAHEFEQECLSF